MTMTIKNNNIYEKSLNGERKVISRKRKKMLKINYKNLVKYLLITATVLIIGIKGTSFAFEKISDKVLRDKALDDANQYMRTKIVTYLEDSGLEYSVLGDKIIFENDQDKLTEFVKMLINDGFSRDEVFYMVSQVCDKKDFDNIVKTGGWENSDEFLEDKYFSGKLSSSGESYITKYGDMEKFENNVEVGYVESVNDLIEIEESKGLNR